MNLFVLTLLPMSLVIFYVRKDIENRAHFLPVLFTGLFTGVLFLAYKLLFSTFFHVPQANIFANFVYYFFSQEFFPIVIVYGLFFLFARKDTLEDRFSFFFPAVVSFFSVFLPYIILETEKPYPAFLLFTKPLLLLAMFIILQVWLSKIPAVKKDVTSLLIIAAVILTALILPALTEALWVVNVFPLLWIIPAVIEIGYAAFLIFPVNSGNN